MCITKIFILLLYCYRKPKGRYYCNHRFPHLTYPFSKPDLVGHWDSHYIVIKHQIVVAELEVIHIYDLPLRTACSPVSIIKNNSRKIMKKEGETQVVINQTSMRKHIHSSNPSTNKNKPELIKTNRQWRLLGRTVVQGQLLLAIINIIYYFNKHVRF
jgi:hypothetical protein